MNFAELKEQRRADQASVAEQRRQDEQARREQDRRDAEAQAEQRRAETEQARQAAAARRARRSAALKTSATWIGQHPIDLLMSVIVVVPAVLAWTAMAVYGQSVYGPVGLMFPLFSEGAMWAFAFATQMARRMERPVWMLQTGLWLFAGVAAVLNYIHGSEVSVRIGIVMAIVSISGVIAHQIHLFSNRPRRTTEDRRVAKREQLAAKRAHRMSLAATRQAPGQVHADGTVHLLVREGTVTLARQWRLWVLPGRRQVEYRPVPGVGADGATAPVPAVGDEVEQWLATVPTDPVPAEGETSGDQQKERVGNAPARGRSWDELVAAFWDAVQAGTVNPTSQRNVRERMQCSRDRAKDLVEMYRSTGSDGDGLGVAA